VNCYAQNPNKTKAFRAVSGELEVGCGGLQPSERTLSAFFL